MPGDWRRNVIFRLAHKEGRMKYVSIYQTTEKLFGNRFLRLHVYYTKQILKTDI